MAPNSLAAQAATLRWKIEGIFVITQVKDPQARQQVLTLLDKPLIATLKKLRSQLRQLVKELRNKDLEASQILQLYEEFYSIHKTLCAWLQWLEPLLKHTKGAAHVYRVLNRFAEDVEELLEDLALWPELQHRLAAISDAEETRSWREVWAEL